MKKEITSFLVVFFLVIQSNCQTGWHVVNTGLTTNINGIYFVDANTGFAAGNQGKIIKTSNGGLNWIVLNSGFSQTLNCIKFINYQTGYACGYGRTILKTTNSGLTWATVFSEITSNSLYDIHCIDSMFVFSVGNYSLFKSTNAGLNWISYSQGFSGNAFEVFFLNRDTGYVLGSQGLHLMTTNGGSNWLGGVYWPSEYGFSSCYFFYATYGFATSSYNSGSYSSGAIYKLSSWNSWTAVYTMQNKFPGDILFTGNDTGYAVGTTSNTLPPGLILKTTNGGTNWFEQLIDTNDNLYCLHFVDSKTGYAAGRSGFMIKTTTGGTVGIETINGNVPSQFELKQNYPNPFNPATKIKFSIPLLRGVSEGRGVYTKLVVYDVLGSEVVALMNEQLKPGTYEVDWNASDYPSGVYYYKIVLGDNTNNGGYTQTKKMVLTK